MDNQAPTLTLEQTEAATANLFETKLVVPEPPVLWKDKLAALEEAKLFRQHAACLFDMRCWQAQQRGFKQMDSDDLVTLLMGSESTHETIGAERQNYEWVYNHHTDDVLKAPWGGMPEIFSRYERQGLWYLPPFASKLVWQAQFGKLDYLKQELPYGVVLRINECKQLRLFNAFNVLAPMEAWERETDIDPIMVASIWEMPPDDKGHHATAGQVAHFFLAQW